MYLRSYAVLSALILVAALAVAQSLPRSYNLTVNGRTGQANVAQINGHSYVDLEALARIADGSVAYRRNQITLTLSHTASSKQPVGLSREFMRSGLEQMGTIREWMTILSFAVRNGYPVTGTWVDEYRGRASERLRQSTVSAATPSDQRALQLLNSQFKNLDAWSANLVAARNAMNAELTINPATVEADPMYQKVIACAQFLNSMLVGGTFEDNANCH